MVRLLFLILFWFSPVWAQAANVTAQLDRNSVTLGDPVTLTFTVAGVIDGGEPDFTPLQKDFDIRGQAQSNNISMINGVSSVQTAWELTLFPHSAGTLTIPSIQFGSEPSPALQLQVTDQPTQNAASGNNTDDILVELVAEPTQPYVQQQTIVTQRLLHSAQLQGQATLSLPEITAGKGTIQAIGNNRKTTTVRNGRNYYVVERRYALLPQQSGTLTIGKTTFEGSLADRSTFDPWGMHSGKRTQRYSQPLTLQIQPQPASYTGKQWLPANSVTLNAHWQTPPQQLKAGEPATLILAIMADGLSAEQLPKLDLQAPVGIKAYTDQPDLSNNATSTGVIGTRQEKWVIVAPYNGEYELPPITLDWWNKTTGKQEVATLNAVKLVVTGGQTVPANPNPPAVSTPATAQTATPAASPAPQATDVAQSGSWFSWGKVAAFLLLVWVVLSLAWLLWWWRNRSQRNAVSTIAKLDTKTAWQNLTSACQQNQPQAAHDALIAWMETVQGMRPALLTQLRAHANADLRAEIDVLGEALYGRATHSWNGARLLQAVKVFKPAAKVPTKRSGLAELYPDV